MTLLVGILVGYLIFGIRSGSDTHVGHSHSSSESTDGGAETIWTCSMHPQIRQSEPGKCPLCAMDLIPAASSGDENEYTLVMTHEAVRLAEIRTTNVISVPANKQIRVPGVVVVDDRSTSTVKAQFSGRIVSHSADFTGRSVTKGEELLRIWSPELISAQRELLDAMSTGDRLPGLLEAARQKLRYLQLSDSQISDIEQRGSIINEVPILAPHDGVIMTHDVRIGEVVEPGMTLYEIADLKQLWVEFDVYEQDIASIRTGQTIQFTSPSLPLQKVTSTISWVDPILDISKRTSRARVDLRNTDMFWRPGMLVNGTINTQVAGGALLVQVPNSAILWTGSRSLVYIQIADADAPTFESREVILGDRVGDMRIILDGLSPGERVVTNGAFKIDAEFQLRDKFSMMNRQVQQAGTSRNQSTGSTSGHSHGSGTISQSTPATGSRSMDTQVVPVSRNANGLLIRANGEILTEYHAESRSFRQQLNTVLDRYFDIKDALYEKDGVGAGKALESFRAAVRREQGSSLSGQAAENWLTYRHGLLEMTAEPGLMTDIEQLRSRFNAMSTYLYEIIERYGVQNVVYYQFCPMAFNDLGAHWLNQREGIENPYLPETMPGCGEVLQRVDRAS